MVFKLTFIAAQDLVGRFCASSGTPSGSSLLGIRGGKGAEMDAELANNWVKVVFLSEGFALMSTHHYYSR